MPRLRDRLAAAQFKDIAQRAAIRDPDLLERLPIYVRSGAGTSFSARPLARFLRSEGRKAAADTVLRYLKNGADLSRLRRIRQEDVRSKRLMPAAERHYVADHGLRQVAAGSSRQDVQFLSGIPSAWSCCAAAARSNDGREISLAAKRGGKRFYVRITYLLASKETDQRESGACQGVPDD